MSKEFCHTYPTLDEYIRQGEPDKKAKASIWQTAIGLQQVDGLKTSDYLLQTARQNIEGYISVKQARDFIDSYYQTEQSRHEIENNDTEEADKVSARIAELLSEKAFTFSPAQLIAIHKHLFWGIYKFAGKVRDYNISKREWVLDGETVFYASSDMIRETLDYDFAQEKNFDYSTVNINQAISHLTQFCCNIWQIHPFGEGNTRTTAVFMIKYLHTLGFVVNNDIFAGNSWYFRNALVRANYTNVVKNISYNNTYLELFFRSMLLNEQHTFQNRMLHIKWNEPPIIQSAVQSVNLSPKCKNCTLEEVAVLRLIQQNPSATQKQIAQQIGKSERTIKSITVRLNEQGIIVRKNGKRNGYWEISE